MPSRSRLHRVLDSLTFIFLLTEKKITLELCNFLFPLAMFLVGGHDLHLLPLQEGNACLWLCFPKAALSYLLADGPNRDCDAFLSIPF